MNDFIAWVAGSGLFANDSGVVGLMMIVLGLLMAGVAAVVDNRAMTVAGLVLCVLGIAVDNAPAAAPSPAISCQGDASGMRP